MVRTLCVFTVTALALTASAPAHAKNKVVDTFKFKSKGLSATFLGGDPCLVVAASVDYIDAATKVNGDSTESATTILSVSYTNTCTHTSVNLTGFTTDQQVRIRGDLGTASLYANVPVTSDAGDAATIMVNLNWTATGPAVTAREKIKSNEGGVKFKLVTETEGRPAEANGTIAGMVPLPSGGLYQNLVFGPSIAASINKNRVGQVTVTRTQKN